MVQDTSGACPAGTVATHEPSPASGLGPAGECQLACRVCDDGGWTCENHRDRPWGGTSGRDDACECGAGAPCGACNLRLASATFSEPWRELACRAIGYVASAVRETNWGQPTFGPYADEELQAEYQALIAKASGAS